MMREILGKAKIIILFIAVNQLLITSCSKNIYPDQAKQKAERREDIKVSPTKKLIVPTDDQAESKKLKYFMASGTGRSLNIKDAKPDEIISSARKYLGVRHCMGGTSSKCLDCSGLLVVVFAKYGITLPHNSQEQARYGKKIARMDQLVKGDLVFFKRSYKTSNYITHSGICIGDNKFIHTSVSNGVTITSFDDTYWHEKFVFGTRIF
jgi:murein DD-endopeptidase / murein LD-carboxypeptidase